MIRIIRNKIIKGKSGKIFKYIDKNNLTINLAAAESGYAYLN